MKKKVSFDKYLVSYHAIQRWCETNSLNFENANDRFIALRNIKNIIKNGILLDNQVGNSYGLYDEENSAVLMIKMNRSGKRVAVTLLTYDYYMANIEARLSSRSHGIYDTSYNSSKLCSLMPSKLKPLARLNIPLNYSDNEFNFYDIDDLKFINYIVTENNISFEEFIVEKNLEQDFINMAKWIKIWVVLEDYKKLDWFLKQFNGIKLSIKPGKELRYFKKLYLRFINKKLYNYAFRFDQIFTGLKVTNTFMRLLYRNRKNKDIQTYFTFEIICDFINFYKKFFNSTGYIDEITAIKSLLYISPKYELFEPLSQLIGLFNKQIKLLDNRDIKFEIVNYNTNRLNILYSLFNYEFLNTIYTAKNLLGTLNSICRLITEYLLFPDVPLDIIIKISVISRRRLTDYFVQHYPQKQEEIINTCNLLNKNFPGLNFDDIKRVFCRANKIATDNIANFFNSVETCETGNLTKLIEQYKTYISNTAVCAGLKERIIKYHGKHITGWENSSKKSKQKHYHFFKKNFGDYFIQKLKHYTLLPDNEKNKIDISADFFSNKINEKKDIEKSRENSEMIISELKTVNLGNLVDLIKKYYRNLQTNSDIKDKCMQIIINNYARELVSWQKSKKVSKQTNFRYLKFFFGEPFSAMLKKALYEMNKNRKIEEKLIPESEYFESIDISLLIEQAGPENLINVIYTTENSIRKDPKVKKKSLAAINRSYKNIIKNWKNSRKKSTRNNYKYLNSIFPEL